MLLFCMLLAFTLPEKYDWETYNQILLHEKIHIDQKHTLSKSTSYHLLTTT